MSKGDDTRQAILMEAARLASRIGLEGLSIGRLATDMSMSKSGLFAHFGAKEELQLQVLAFTRELYIDEVIQPAFSAPAGEPRVRLLFENWLRWANHHFGGGCPFVQYVAEFDDRPGEIRQCLAASQQDWMAVLAGAARRAMDAGHFRADLDPEQFAFEFQALLLGYHSTARMVGDPAAEQRVRTAFESLLTKSH